MNRWDIINLLIQKNNYKSYLEIGYFKGWSFDNVNCRIKTAVDPNPSKNEVQQTLAKGQYIGEPISHSQGGADILYKMTSDEFFADYASPFTWDIVFIDGLHEASQVEKDIRNSLNHLSPGGTIVLHDCNPPTLAHATTGDHAGNWNGDVYKAFVRFRGANPQYETYVIDTDWGCGVIRERRRQEVAGEQLAVIDNIDEIITPSEAEYFIKDWEFFDQNRAKALNIISVEEFIKKTNERIENHQLSAQ